MNRLVIAVLAVVPAVGGGTVRDLLLGRHPVGWARHSSFSYAFRPAGDLRGTVD
jgi:uncharacterized membrane protein YeiH